MPPAEACDAPLPELAVYRLAHGEAPVAGPAHEPVSLDWNVELLHQNAAWFCRLRWLVIGVLAVAGAAASGWDSPFLRGLHLRPGWLLPVAALLGAMNLAYAALLRRPPARQEAVKLRRLLWVQIAVDLVALTVVVHFLGSTDSAAPFMYLFHLILACIFFPPRQSLVVTLLAAFLHLADVGLGSLAGSVGDAASVSPAFPMLRSLGNVSIWAVIWYLASKLARAVRDRDRELAAANARLVASCDERARHMLQTTHQLKAPFAAIHANIQLLLAGICGPLPPKAVDVVRRMAARCLALSQQIQDMIQLANLRSAAQSNPGAAELDVAELLARTISRLQPTATARGVRIDPDLTPAPVRAVEDHLRMVVDNLLSNAINYSHEGGLVTVGCQPRANRGARLLVADQGIGIPKEKLPRIFEDYFRTNEAAHHNPSSTGLGLAIVRDVTRLAGMDLEVETAVGRGTRFTLTIPPSPVTSGRAANP